MPFSYSQDWFLRSIKEKYIYIYQRMCSREGGEENGKSHGYKREHSWT